jgi:hypothetical protein
MAFPCFKRYIQPEYVSLTVPGTRGNNNNILPPPLPQLPGFLRIGINWRQVCNDFDRSIIEPCDTLVTRDGYGLTAEGVRVLACFAGGALVLRLCKVKKESIALCFRYSL